MAPRVNISTPVHDPHASTIPHVQMSQVLNTSVFVNQDIQVRSMLKSWLYFITTGTKLSGYFGKFCYISSL
jgi:hypothetical protein